MASGIGIFVGLVIFLVGMFLVPLFTDNNTIKIVVAIVGGVIAVGSMFIDGDNNTSRI